jgi:hypothetical protein
MFGWIRNAFDWASGKIDDTIRGWVSDLIHGLYAFLHLIFGAVGAGWDELSRYAYDLRVALDKFSSATARGFDDLYHWINKEGREVFYYITHPAKLVDLIWDDILAKLEREAWTVGERLGKFFMSLILHNLKRFMLLLEDILHAAL